MVCIAFRIYGMLYIPCPKCWQPFLLPLSWSGLQTSQLCAALRIARSAKAMLNKHAVQRLLAVYVLHLGQLLDGFALNFLELLCNRLSIQ